MSQTEHVEQLTDTGGCPVCDAGRVVHWCGNVGYLIDLHYTDQLGTFEHDEAAALLRDSAQ